MGTCMLHIHIYSMKHNICVTYTQVIILTSLSLMIFFMPEKNEENIPLQQVHIPSSLWHPFSKEAMGSTNTGVLQKGLFI